MPITARDIVSSVNAVRVSLERFHSAMMEHLDSIEESVRGLAPEERVVKPAPVASPIMPIPMIERQARNARKRVPATRRVVEQATRPARAAARKQKSAPGASPVSQYLPTAERIMAKPHRYSELRDVALEWGLTIKQFNDLWQRLQEKGLEQVPQRNQPQHYWPWFLPAEHERTPRPRQRRA